MRGAVGTHEGWAGMRGGRGYPWKDKLGREEQIATEERREGKHRRCLPGGAWGEGRGEV